MAQYIVYQRPVEETRDITVSIQSDNLIISGYRNGYITIVDSTNNTLLYHNRNNNSHISALYMYSDRSGVKQLFIGSINGNISSFSSVHFGSRNTYTEYPIQHRSSIQSFIQTGENILISRSTQQICVWTTRPDVGGYTLTHNHTQELIQQDGCTSIEVFQSNPDNFILAIGTTTGRIISWTSTSSPALGTITLDQDSRMSNRIHRTAISGLFIRRIDDRMTCRSFSIGPTENNCESFLRDQDLDTYPQENIYSGVRKSCISPTGYIGIITNENHVILMDPDYRIILVNTTIAEPMLSITASNVDTFLIASTIQLFSFTITPALTAEENIHSLNAQVYRLEIDGLRRTLAASNESLRLLRLELAEARAAIPVASSATDIQMAVATALEDERDLHTCAVCYEPHPDTSFWVCGHLFHNTPLCLRDWTQGCPNCRENRRNPEPFLARYDRKYLKYKNKYLNLKKSK